MQFDGCSGTKYPLEQYQTWRWGKSISHGLYISHRPHFCQATLMVNLELALQNRKNFTSPSTQTLLCSEYPHHAEMRYQKALRTTHSMTRGLGVPFYLGSSIMDARSKKERNACMLHTNAQASFICTFAHPSWIFSLSISTCPVCGPLTLILTLI